jgi:hypothetical protein
VKYTAGQEHTAVQGNRGGVVIGAGLYVQAVPENTCVYGISLVLLAAARAPVSDSRGIFSAACLCVRPLALAGRERLGTSDVPSRVSKSGSV